MDLMPERQQLSCHHDIEHHSLKLVELEEASWILHALWILLSYCFLVSRFGFPQKQPSDRNSTVIHLGSNPRKR